MSSNNQQELLKYYLRELTYLRHKGAEFRERYPRLAGRLDIGDHQSTDPHVERLLESFAFLTGRIQYNLDSEFPEIPSALLETLYPHLQAPIPSMAVAAFEPDPEQGKLTAGHTIPRHTSLFADTHEGHVCRFRTCYPVTLWPLTVMAACATSTSLYGPVLWLRLRAQGAALQELELDRLRFYLRGSRTLVNTLYELLFCRARGVYVQPSSNNERQVTLTEVSRLPDGSIAPVGFEPDEAALPYPRHVHPGYRLLQEYFSFPQKFHFFELQNIDLHKLGARFDLAHSFGEELRLGGCVSAALRRRFEQYRIFLVKNAIIQPDDSQPYAWFIVENEQPSYQVRQVGEQLYVFDLNTVQTDTFDIWITFDAEAQLDFDFLQQIGATVNRDTFQLGCTPIINLFPLTADPIRLDHTQSEYRLTPDARQETITEVHSIQSVTALTEWGAEVKPVAPFYGLDHASARQNVKAFWHARRAPSLRQQVTGTEVYLSFVDLDFNPLLPDAQTVYAQTLCTNRRLAEELSPGASLQIELAAPLHRITCLDKPTPQIEPPLRGATLWKLVSQLSLNHLTLDETVQFGVEKRHTVGLENKLVSKELRLRFQDRGVFLSPSVTVADPTQYKGWLLIDHEANREYLLTLNENQLSVSSGHQGLRALREILALYSAADQGDALEQIMGLEAMYCRRVTRRLGAQACWPGFSRGIEITLVFDEERYASRDAFLLATVLHHFFALYVGVNMFTQLVARRVQRTGVWKQWPPMAGRQVVL
jgi:type VI protein secretion system component VasA